MKYLRDFPRSDAKFYINPSRQVRTTMKYLNQLQKNIYELINDIHNARQYKEDYDKYQTMFKGPLHSEKTNILEFCTSPVCMRVYDLWKRLKKVSFRVK